jgi:hypothetical protein
VEFVVAALLDEELFDGVLIDGDGAGERSSSPLTEVDA